MNKSFLMAVLILLSLVNSTKIFSGTFSASDDQKNERKVRFELINTENELINDYGAIVIYDAHHHTVEYLYPDNHEINLPDGTYTYGIYTNFFLPTELGSFTVADEDITVSIIFNKVRFYFSGKDDVEKRLRLRISRSGEPNDYFFIETDNKGYVSVNLLPGNYDYKAIRDNIEVASGQLQLSGNSTQDINVEITGIQRYTFFMKTSTGKVRPYVGLTIYDSDNREILSFYPYSINDSIVCYLPENKQYSYLVYMQDVYVESDRIKFTVNSQDTSTTILFYPVTFKQQETNNANPEITPRFIFSRYGYYASYYEKDENNNPVFYFLPGHYDFTVLTASYPSYPTDAGSFDVDSLPQVVEYSYQIHEVKFIITDLVGEPLSGYISIGGGYSTGVSTEGIAIIHLPDGNYTYSVNPYDGNRVEGNLTVTGKDTTIVIEYKKLIINILNNKNEPVDLNPDIRSEYNYVQIQKISPGVYYTYLSNGNFRVSVAYPAIWDSTVVIRDADKILNIRVNQVLLQAKTAGGKTMNENIYFNIWNENNQSVFYGSPASIYLSDGHYTYTASRNYVGTSSAFDINHEDKEITLTAYPVTFKVMLSNQLPVINYGLGFNGSYLRPDKRDEYTSEYLLLQGDYDYEVSATSLQGNSIYSKGKIKVNGSMEIPVTFYALEASVTLDGKPVAGSSIRLWQGEYSYNNITLYVNDDGMVRDYVSNGLYNYAVEPPGGGLASSGSFSIDSQNVKINADFYSVRFIIGQTSIDYYITLTDMDSGEEIGSFGPSWNDSIVTTRLVPGHYAYRIRSGYYYDAIYSKGEFTIENQPVDIDESFLPHHFIISNPHNRSLYYFAIYRNDIRMISTYIYYDLNTFSYLLPKGEYTYECYGSDLRVSGAFKVENPGEETYILFDTGIEMIDDESGFRIYPNPASDMIWFDLPVDGDITISAMDGKTVLRQTLRQQKSLDISNLKKGVYMIGINDSWNHKRISRKLVVK